MKKILTYLFIIQAISFAKTGIELKIGVNASMLQERSRYYNLYSQSQYAKSEGSLATRINNEIDGELDIKVLKSMSVNSNTNIKVGGGLSVYLYKSQKLTTMFRQREDKKADIPKKGKPDNKMANEENVTEEMNIYNKFKDLKYNNGSARTVSNNDYNGSYSTERYKDMLNMLEQHNNAIITAFSTFEVEKILRPSFSVYLGTDLGLDISLTNHSAETYLQNNANGQPNNGNTTISKKYVIERRTKLLPRVKGYIGVDYNNFEFEIGAGYPQIVTVGIGYRFKF